MTDDRGGSTPPRLTTQDLQRMVHRSTTQVYLETGRSLAS